MKLRKLDLRAFGSLRDVTLDFSDDAPAPCLHVVYGPNEAGKSTALRALTGLFFGIPNSTRDAHSVRPAELRVGALLRDSQGRERYVLRRKGLKDTLRAEDDKTALPAEEALWVSAGMHASTFETQFGLTFETLHRGAEELLGSGGDLGQSLFAAAVNGGQVRRVLESLEQEANELYRPKGSKMLLNAAIAKFDQAKKESRELATKADVVEQQLIEVQRAVAASAEINAKLTTLRAERAKLERVRNILPLLSRQRVRQAERDGLGELPRLAADAPEERKRAQAALRDAQMRLEHASGELERLAESRAKLEQNVLPEFVAFRASESESLRDQLSLYRENQRKLPSRKEALVRARSEVERACQALQLTEADAQHIEQLRLPKTIEARARELLRRGELLRVETQTERRKFEDARHSLEQAKAKLWQLWAAAQEPQQKRAQLTLLTTAAPPRAALLSDELCRHFEKRFDHIEQEQRALETKRSAAQEQLERNEQAREELSRHGAPPAQADLDQARQQRDSALSELRILLSTEPQSNDARAIAPQSNDAPGVVPRSKDARVVRPHANDARAIGFRSNDAHAVVYVERAMALNVHADALSDHMRREADRVARAAQLAADHSGLLLNLERSQEALQACETRSHELHAEWDAHFRAAGLAVRLPREALRLLTSQRELDQLIEQLERQAAIHERAHNSALTAEREWSEHWVELAQTLALDASFRKSATKAMSPAELEALLGARSELLQRYDAAQSCQDELSALTQQLTAFEQQVAQLSAAYAPVHTEERADIAAERMLAAHKQTQRALQQIEEADHAMRERDQASRAAQLELNQAERRLQQLMAAAAVDNDSALEQAEQRSVRAQELDAELARDAADLAAECGGEDAEALVAEVGLSIDQVRVRLAELDDDYKQLDEERLQHTQQLASKRSGLTTLHEKHLAGDAASDAALHLEEVRTLAENYVRLRLAASLLRREIAHYRERHRGPVLEKAAQWFCRLTMSAYAGLDVDYDERDQPVLTCLRADKHRVSVAALSTGTRDQLFLALRLASIEHLGAQRELMPLVLDDILVHFDDSRARAALVALSEFAATTQVIFFTHHEHLCKLASEAVATEHLRIHRLPHTPIKLQLTLAPS